MRFRTHPSVVCTVLDQGGVLLHLDTKFYYSLNPTGLAIWVALEEGGADLAGLASLCAAVPSVDSEVRRFLDELSTEKLIETDAAGNGSPVPVTVPSSAGPAPDAEPPRLTRHAIPLSQILSSPFDPSVPLAE